MLLDVVVRKIGSNKQTPRLYLDMVGLERACFKPGTLYRVRVDEADRRVVLELNDGGERIVSSKSRGERKVPVVDLQSTKALQVFEGFERVRVVLMRGRIYILPLASDLAKQERLERLRAKFENDEPLAVASLCHGAGMLAYAAHEGLKAAGVKAETSVVNEIDEGYAAQSYEHNPVWAEDTLALVGPMQEVVQDEWLMAKLPKVEIVEIGIPCSGASRAGVSKLKLAQMEQHPEVGHLLPAALMLIQKLQPSALVIENVPSYQHTGSAWIARGVLRDAGYETFEVELDSSAFGSLEARRRWFLIALTDGLSIDFAGLAPEQVKARTVGEVLDDIADDDPRWSPLTYLKEKQARDEAAGKGFRMQTVNASSTRVPTLRKAYAKGGSTDPVVEHPSGNGLLRRFTGAEHARIKNFPPALIAGLPDTRAHEVLGQGVSFAPVKALFERLGKCLRDAVQAGASPTRKGAAYALEGTG